MRRPSSISGEVDSGDTLDESPVVATPAGEVSDGPTEIGAWEQFRLMRAEIAESKRVAADAQRDARTARRKLERAEKIVFSAIGALIVGVGAVLKIAFSAGDKSAVERQHDAWIAEVRHAVDHMKVTTLPEMRSTVAQLAATVANLKGTIDAISRLGAVRVFGPQPKPLVSGDDDP